VFIFKLLHKIRTEESDTKNKSMKRGFLSTEGRILSTGFYGYWQPIIRDTYYKVFEA